MFNKIFKFENLNNLAYNNRVCCTVLWLIHGRQKFNTSLTQKINLTSGINLTPNDGSDVSLFLS